MNSSGIKRGLAATAVGALAVTGLPFLASSASAAPGDVIQVSSVGATRNGGTVGGVVVLKTKNVADSDNLKVVNTALTGLPNNANQSVEIVDRSLVVANGAAGDSNKTDGFDEITLNIAVTTSADGDAANYAIYEDEDEATQDPTIIDVDAAEARVQVTQSTSGAPTTLSVAPSTQTAPAGTSSGAYVVTIKDSAGRTTQLTGTPAETVVVNPDADTALNALANDADLTVAAADAPKGVFEFTAKSSATTLHELALDGPATADAKAYLDVVTSFTALTPAMVDIVTGADDWDGFGYGTDGGTTQVRPDQTSVKFDINAGAANAGKTVSLTATGTGVTFGGAGSTTLTATLDASGKGSITVTPDAGTISANDSIAIVAGDFDQTISFKAPALQAANVTTDAQTYLSSFGGSVTVKVSVKDQYGNPVTGTYVGIDREGGRNDAATESARTAVDANGVATITLTDAATGNSTASDNLDIAVYPGQLGGALVSVNNAAVVAYSSDGLGADFTVTADGNLPDGSAYNPNNVFARPLTDTAIDATVPTPTSDPESIVLGITGGTPGAPVTVTVDNGALVLKGTETRLGQGSASDSSTIGGAQLKIIGTKSGLVNVTVASGGRTKTFQVSARAFAQDNVDNAASARNIEVSGPEEGQAGEVVNFTAKVLDAFGNPVKGVAANTIQTVVTGGGQVIGNSGASNAAGEIVFQVQIGDSADGALNFRATGTGNQFGAAADRLGAGSTTNDGAGLATSEATDVATIENVVNIEDLEQAVEEAQAKVDAAQDALDAAKGDFAVAKAEKRVAQQAVKAAKKDLKKAKKQHKGVNAAKKALREAKGDLTVANAKVKSANGKVNRAENRLDAAQAELEAAEQALEDAQN